MSLLYSHSIHIGAYYIACFVHNGRIQVIYLIKALPYFISTFVNKNLHNIEVDIDITENLSSNITLAKVSVLVNYNESYISRLFKSVTDEGVSEYINHARPYKP